MYKGHSSPGMRDFTILWATQTLSALGSAMTSFALVLWSYGQSGSAVVTALLSVSSYAPYVLMSLFAGALIDRLNAETDQNNVQAYYNEILSTIADECLAVPVTNAHDLTLYNTDKIAGYSGNESDPQYVLIYGVELK